MKQFIVYNTSSGEILRTGSCPESIFSQQAHSGESILEGTTESRDTLFKVVDGALVEKEVVVLTTAEILDEARGIRNYRLQRTDWTQAVDSPLTVEKKAEYVTYRRALRDLPINNASVTSYKDITWPTAPS